MKMVIKHVKIRSLLLILLFFFIFRLTVLFSSTNLFFGKELYVGTVAFDLLKGSTIPLWEYHIPHETGARLFMGLFTIPFFIVLGVKGLVLKIAALSFSSMILIAYYLFLRRYFGKPAAYFFGLFFVAACPLFTRFNLINVGNYIEPTLFVPLAFYPLYKILYENNRDSPKQILYYLIMGFWTGFGIWFFYLNIITLVVCLIMLLLHYKEATRKNILYFVLGVGIGLLPWFYYNITHNFTGLLIKTEQYFVPISQWLRISSFYLNIKDFFFSYLPSSYCFFEKWLIISRVVSYTHYLIFIIAFVYLCYLCIAKQRNIFPILLFIILLLFTFLLNEVSDNIQPKRGFVGYRYFVPLYLFQLIVLALFTRYIRFLALKIIVIGFMIASGIFGISQDISFKNILKKNYRFYSAYSYEVLGFRLAEANWSFNEKKAIHLIDMVNKNSRNYAYQGLGWEAASKLNSGEIKELSIINALKPEYRKDFFIGLGQYSSHEITYEKGEKERQLKRERLKFFLKNIPKEHLDDFYYGLGQKTFLTFQDDVVEWMGYPKEMNLDSAYLPYYYQGAGFAIGRTFGFNKVLCNDLLKKAPREYLNDCYQGFFSGLTAKQFSK